MILMYDITDRTTFDAIDNWVSEAKKYTSANIPMILVGNKSDEERKVSFEEGEEIASKYEMAFIEVSVKDNINVEKTFELLTKGMLYSEKEAST